MEWFAHKTKPNEFRYDLLINHGTNGYYVYFRAIEILGEEDKFYEHKRAGKEQLEIQFFPLKIDAIEKILFWISDQPKAKFVFSKDADKYFLYTSKLAEMNKEYCRKHNIKAEKIEFPDNVRTMSGTLPEIIRPTRQDKTRQYKTINIKKEKKIKNLTLDSVGMVDIVKMFCQLRKELKSNLDDYVPKWAKEVKLATSIKAMTSETIKKKMIIYFNTDDLFYKKNGYDFPIFISKINSFTIKQVKKSAFTPEAQ